MSLCHYFEVATMRSVEMCTLLSLIGDSCCFFLSPANKVSKDLPLIFHSIQVACHQYSVPV